MVFHDQISHGRIITVLVIYGLAWENSGEVDQGIPERHLLQLRDSISKDKDSGMGKIGALRDSAGKID